jgi:uncharacterized membrane protein YphA (DoxX/SURF4 family)
MNIFQMFGMYLGRLLLSAIFLISAIQEMLDWASTEQYFLMSMTRWMNSFHANEFMSTLLSNIFPWMPWLLLLAVVFKLVGSVLLVLGLNVRLGALLLILFLVPTTLIVHGFWNLPVQERPLEMVLFMKNISILGGLLVALAVGSGKAPSKSG